MSRRELIFHNLMSLNHIKVIYDFLGSNAIVTLEECDTGIACDGLTLSICPETTTAPTTETSQPPTKSPVTADPNISHATFGNKVVEVDPNKSVTTSSETTLKTFGVIISTLLALLI